MTKEIELTADIVAAFVANNNLPKSELASLIEVVHETFVGLGSGGRSIAPAVAEKRSPAVLVSKSITNDFIVCLEDGKKFKSMKRHLSQLGITPAEYRAKWGLPGDYPMVAPAYSSARSAIAKGTGLGRKVSPAK